MRTLLVLQSYDSVPQLGKPITDFVRVLDAAKACEEDPPVLYLDPLEESDLENVKKIASETPNLTLNVAGAIIKPRELWLYALLGILLQSVTLAIPALGTYHWKWLRKGTPIPEYAYGCFVGGSVLIMVGALCCGHVIEGSTTEFTLQPSNKGDARIQRILRLQIHCIVSSQHFPSAAILNDPKEEMLIRTSRLNNKNYK